VSDTTTTRARAWALTRRDGAVLGFTDHDRDLSFDGIVFRAETGMTAKALMQTTGLSVDNTEASGALSSAGLTEADILAGRYDAAELRIWQVDWADVATRILLFRGTLGEISRAGGAFRVELRGLSEPLSRSGGRVFGALCPAVLGDAACKVELSAPVFVHQCQIVTVEEGGATLVLPPLPRAAGWFAHGRGPLSGGCCDRSGRSRPARFIRRRPAPDRALVSTGSGSGGGRHHPDRGGLRQAFRNMPRKVRQRAELSRFPAYSKRRLADAGAA
jgi:uncharacterized phage protein (TIGR02218 family)